MSTEPKPVARKYAHVLRPLTQDERSSLRSHLQEHGLLHDLVLDQHGDLLDGHHREELCAELGIVARYKTVTTDDPVQWIKALQKARRNLNREEMRELIAEQILATPHLSNRTIAKVVGTSDPTVGKVRAQMIADDQIGNVVRFDKKGRANPDRPGRAKSSHVDQLEASTVPAPAEPKRRKHAAPAPVRKSERGLINLADNIVHLFADDDEFHKEPEMIAKIDPNGSLGMTSKQLRDSIYALSRGTAVRVETRPAAKGQKHYRFYRQDRLIGLSVLKAKFRPVIEALIAEGRRPISHQSTGRFLDAANAMTQLLRDLEAE